MSPGPSLMFRAVVVHCRTGGTVADVGPDVRVGTGDAVGGADDVVGAVDPGPVVALGLAVPAPEPQAATARSTPAIRTTGRMSDLSVLTMFPSAVKWCSAPCRPLTSGSA